MTDQPILVIGATGKTCSRVAAKAADDHVIDRCENPIFRKCVNSREKSVKYKIISDKMPITSNEELASASK